jgi:hypothetical protein
MGKVGTGGYLRAVLAGAFMPAYLVRCFNDAHRPESPDYHPVDAEDELSAAIKACGGESLIRAGKPGDLRALVHTNPPKSAPKAFFRQAGPVSR